MAKNRSKKSGGVRPYKVRGRQVGWRAEAVRYKPCSDERAFYQSKVFKTAEGYTKADAEAWLAGVTKELNAGRLTGASTLGDWLTAWLRIQTAAAAAKTSSRDAQVVESHVRPHLGTVRLATLDANAINGWLADLAHGGASGDQVHRAWATLRKCLNTHDGFDAARLDKVKTPKVTRKKRRTMTVEQVEALVATADSWADKYPFLGAMVRVWLECCLRPSELLGLRWEDFDGREVHVAQTLCIITFEPKPPKTASGDRRTPLSADTAAAVAAWKAANAARKKPEPLVMFPGPRNGYTRYPWFVNKLWKPLAKAAGLEGWVPYEVRHTAASHLVSNGGSLLAIANRMGHADANLIYKVYAHVLPKDQDKLTAMFSGLTGRRAG